MWSWFEIFHEVVGKRLGRLSNLKAGLGNRPLRRLTHMVWVVNRKPQSLHGVFSMGCLSMLATWLQTSLRVGSPGGTKTDETIAHMVFLGNRASLAAQQQRTCLLVQEMEV